MAYEVFMPFIISQCTKSENRHFSNEEKAYVTGIGTDYLFSSPSNIQAMMRELNHEDK
jgi:hypothetical protein